MALRSDIVVRTDEQLELAATRHKFRPALATYDAVSAGTHLATVILTTQSGGGEEEVA